MRSPSTDPHASTRGLVARLIDSYNPGITMLVVLWIAAFALRARLVSNGTLESITDDALRSLLLVIPIMLVGWGLLVIVDRRFRLGLFRPRDDQGSST